MLITVAQAKRDVSHNIVSAFSFAHHSAGWEVRVHHSSKPGAETLCAAQSDQPRYFKSLDAAVSIVSQISGQSVDSFDFSFLVEKNVNVSTSHIGT